MQIVSEFYFSIIPEWLISSNLSDNAIRVYVALYRFADKNDGTCYPSVATIGKKCNKSPSSVKRGLKELKLIGAIEVRERYIEEKGQTSNLYILKLNPAFKNELGGQVISDTGGSSDMDYKPKKNNQSQYIEKDKNNRNKIYMTLTEHLYKPKTKTEIGGFNKVAKSLDEIGATPDQVLEKIEIYKKKWKDITLTPYALEKNWSLLETMKDPTIKKRDCKTEGCKWIDLDVIYYCQFCKKEKSKKND
jgi:predicted transcriptional regulator